MAATYAQEGRSFDLGTLISAHASNYQVGLYTNASGLSVTSTLADIVPASFPGYASQTPAWGSTMIDANGNARNIAAPLLFTQSVDDTPQDVYGSYLYDSTNIKLYYWEDFSSGPQTFQFSGDFRSITARLYQGNVTPPL